MGTYAEVKDRASMLTIYRRHTEKCEHKPKGRKWNRCKCPIWTDGTLNGQELRTSLERLGCDSWAKAQAKVREWETSGKTGEKPTGTLPIREAMDRFVAMQEAKGLSRYTIRDTKGLLNRTEAFCTENGIRFMSQWTYDLMEKFRISWKVKPRAARQYLVGLRKFFAYATTRGWSENHAKSIDLPTSKQVPTLPFSIEEMKQILSDLSSDETVRTFCLLLRYSGLRIGDAFQLTEGRLEGDRLFLYTSKTGVPVFVVLPDFVVKQLRKVSKPHPEYFFWNGRTKVDAAIGGFRKRMFRRTKRTVKNFHPHRFRDTFAIELLQAGVPLDRVSVLLGHTDIRVTQRHYGAWVKTRQQQLEDDLRRTLNSDPLAKVESAKTQTQKLVRVK